MSDGGLHSMDIKLATFCLTFVTTKLHNYLSTVLSGKTTSREEWCNQWIRVSDITWN